MHFFIQTGSAHKPCWFPSTDRRTGITRPTVICPNCRRESLLVKHQINPDGMVIPGFHCRYECSFDDFLFLKEWKLGAMVPWMVKHTNVKNRQRR